MTLGASSYLLHEGDVVTGYLMTLNTALPKTANLTGGTTITSTSGEDTFKFESFYLPAFTEIVVKKRAVRAVTVESVSGNFAVGETFVTGSGGNTATATVFAVAQGSGNTIVSIGPTTLAGSGSEFAAGDSITASGGATGTIATGGIGTANNEFTFTESGGTEQMYLGVTLTVFTDRTYRFNVADSSMSSVSFKLSTTINGEYGPDGDFTATSDNGTEYTTGKTSSGTAGQAGAFVQYAFGESTQPANLYYYDGGTGTASNANYGGVDRIINLTNVYTYPGFYVFDKVGTIVDNTDTFLLDGVTYTITSQTAGAYGYVRDYTGSVLTFIKGLNSGDFSGSDTFRDVPRLNGASRTTATINSVDVASAAVEVSNYLVDGDATGNNEVDKITSLVLGPGETLVVKSTTANNIFSLIGFEDASNSITTRIFGQS